MSVIWLTGLSGSGKSTIAEELSKQASPLFKFCVHSPKAMADTGFVNCK